MYLDEINLDAFVHSTTLIRMNGKLTLSLFLSISLSLSLSNFLENMTKKQLFYIRTYALAK